MNASPDNNVETIRQRLLDRSVVGFAKYGVTTERTDLNYPEWLTHLQEELLDAAVYVEAAQATTNLYLATILTNIDKEEYESFVISAKSTSDARFLVLKHLFRDSWEKFQNQEINISIIGKAYPYIQPNVIICSSINIE